ncbi:hypothetical protein PFICI_13834 [Pestalotiopsis fici W106-1]|uniref:Uncharacterized protein n=1 Tax=Pestalotiopsis fici (strain W106-1 / CGMCC3.15140) TaxID=1229662 RepID=W3WJB3_PESFW|nr:uncharacterized protein PFICI_13834 [Pestalotiopsis fici W106-1]ETS73968.1 hypothetical protein PFICI_13834 [Pestalotiopsis fici W106-1]
MKDQLNPYAKLFSEPKGPGDQRPTALGIVKDNDLLGTWTDKVVLLTGGTSGIGVETARALYATGAHVFITARSMDKAEATVQDITSSINGRGSIGVIEMDMDSLESVRKAADDFLSRTTRLNVLINNAGIMACPRTLTMDGFERQFAVNYLAHFALTILLLPSLMASSSSTFNSRVVNVSSSSHRFSSVDFSDINLTHSYDPYRAYGQSKTALNWLSNYIDRAYGPRGVHALCLNPGGIWTGLQGYATPQQLEEWKKDKETMKQMQSPAQGAATTVWAAAGKVWEGHGGRYLSSCRVATQSENETNAIDDGYAPYNYDTESEERLWKLSLEMTGLSAP